MTTPAEIARSLTDAQRRAVPGYEGLYEIDANGNVFSLQRTFTRNMRGYSQLVSVPARQLARTFSRKGYPQATLYKANKGKTWELHRLVCIVFNGGPIEGKEVAHLNGNKTDCRASNLAWVSRSENALHKRTHGTMLLGSSHGRSRLTEPKAIEIFQRAHAGESATALARENGVSEACIRKIKSGKTWATFTSSVRQILEERNDAG